MEINPNQLPESYENSKPSQERQHLLLNLLANGLLRLLDVDCESLQLLNNELNLAWDLINSEILVAGNFNEIITNLNDFINLLEKSLNQWSIDWQDLPPTLTDFQFIESGYISDNIADNFVIKKAQNSIYNEYIQSVLLKILNIAPTEYPLIRRFIIENKIISEREFRNLRGQVCNDNFDLLLKFIYQELPISFRRNGNITYCSYCGKVFQSENTAYRCSKKCLANRGHYEQIAAPTNTRFWTLRNPIRLFIAMPGIPEIALYNYLQTLKNKNSFIHEVVLYPNLDQADILVKFNDGQNWAIDVKDYVNPYALAELIRNEKENPRPSDWNRFLYAYSDKLATITNRYGEILKNQVRTQPENIVYSIKMLKEEINNYIQNHQGENNQ